MNQYGDFGKETEELMTICERNDRIPPELFKEFGVKRGLRDVDGTGAVSYTHLDVYKRQVMRQMNSEDAVVTAVSSVQPQDARDVWDGSTV